MNVSTLLRRTLLRESVELKTQLRNGERGTSRSMTEMLKSVAKITYRSDKSVVTSSGFAIGDGSLLLTSYHPLQQFNDTNGDVECDKSVIITDVASALRQSDLLLLRIDPPLDPLPVSPYPVTGDVDVYVGKAFERTSVRGYQDAQYQDAKTGTYEDLSTMLFNVPPSGVLDGTSGGPILSPTRAVCGIIRGHEYSHGQNGHRGFATPAEKVWWMFKLL